VLIKAVLDDYRSAPIPERTRAMLGFLQKVTLEPGETTGSDVAVLREAGLVDEAIEEALYVAFCFNLIDRLADAFGFEIPADKFASAAQMLCKRGYWAGSVPG
jgi:alkylhydroperoxidase family enzyme